MAERFAVSLPAVIKHLDVLVDAGLVTRTRTGRTVTCRLTPEPTTEAMAWLERHTRFWEPRLDALSVVLEQERKANDDPKRPGRNRGQRPR